MSSIPLLFSLLYVFLTVARHKVTVGKHEVVWFGDTDVRWFKTSDYSSKVMNFVGRKLMGKGKHTSHGMFFSDFVLLYCVDETYGSKHLRRGYWDICRQTDCLPPIKHVVFVIHGVGQCMEGADICKSTSE